MEDRKLQCPNCAQPMQLKRIQADAEEQPTFVHYECKPCGVGISDTVDTDSSDRTLQ